MKPDGQLILGFGCPQPREILPDANRHRYMALLGKMLLASLEAQPGKEKP